MKYVVIAFGLLFLSLPFASPTFAGPLHDVVVAAKATAQATIAAAKVADAGNTRQLIHDYVAAVKTAEHTILAEVQICEPTRSC